MRALVPIMPMLLLAACSGNGGATAAEVGAPATRDYALGGFTGIALRGSDGVVVHTGPAFAVRAEAPQGVLDRLELTVVNGTLTVGRRNDEWDWGGSKAAARITVTLPMLTSAVVGGSGDMTIDRAAGSNFSGTVTGSGDLDVAALETGTATLTIAGSGNVTARGKTGSGSYSVAGSGDLDAKDVAAETISASVAGSGDIDASASGSAAISIVGSGDVKVRGGAKCTVDKVGSGDAVCG